MSQQSTSPANDISSDEIGQNDAFELEVLRLVNELRADHGLNLLSLDTSLNKAADVHSRNMANDDFFAHRGADGSSPAQRAAIAGYESGYVGENIAAGYGTPESVMQGWINSPGHLANLLRENYNEIGIGYYYKANDTGEVNYRRYWTQVFGRGTVEPESEATLDDLLTGDSRDNTFNGYSGDDTLEGGAGNDRLIGDSGADELMGGDDQDTLLGGRGLDKLTGGAGGDHLEGGHDKDVLWGDGGKDVLLGGKGKDRLEGGGGKDIFVLSKGDGPDKIMDFTKRDQIGLGKGVKYKNLSFKGSKIFHKSNLLATLVGVDAGDLSSSVFSNYND